MMTKYKWEWTTYTFEPFGLTCDIFTEGPIAVMLDERQPDVGYLSQSQGLLVLTITYGPGETLDKWLRLLLNEEIAEVSIVEDRRVVQFCGSTAEQVVAQIVPPPPAVGHKIGPEGLEPVSGGYEAPFLQTIVGTHHRQIPLTAVFQKPVEETAVFDELEAHFFASFRCT